MLNAIYFYYDWGELGNIPSLMEKYGVKCKLQFRKDTLQMTNNVFALELERPFNIACYPLLQKYISMDIRIPEEHIREFINNFSAFMWAMQREDGWYTANYYDYNNLYHMIFSFCYKFIVTEKIDVVFLVDGPHLGWDFVLAEAAKMLGVKVVVLFDEKEPETRRSLIYATNTVNPEHIYDHLTKKRETNIVVPQKFEKKLEYMNNIIIPQAHYLKVHLSKRILLRLLLPFNKKFIRSNKLKRYFKNLYRSYRMKVSLEARDKYILPVDFSKKYVYFGLHLQPEGTTSVWGDIYCDQLLAIERLAEMIPDDWKIYVKENPKQTGDSRGTGFYERLHCTKKAILVPNETNTYDLMKHSQFVASIRGTMIYEAVCGGKPAVMFGHFWFDKLPGVFRYRDSLTVDEILSCSIDHDQIQKVVNDVHKKMAFGTNCIAQLLPNEKKNFNKKENEELIVQFLLEALEWK